MRGACWGAQTTSSPVRAHGVTSEWSFDPSVPQFPHLLNGGDTPNFAGLF